MCVSMFVYHGAVQYTMSFSNGWGEVSNSMAELTAEIHTRLESD